MAYVLRFFYPMALATAYGPRLKFFRTKHSASAEGENCAYGPTLLFTAECELLFTCCSFWNKCLKKFGIWLTPFVFDVLIILSIVKNVFLSQIANCILMFDFNSVIMTNHQKMNEALKQVFSLSYDGEIWLFIESHRLACKTENLQLW